MAPFELLDPYYNKEHRGLLIAQGKELNTLRPRTHSDSFKQMHYDDRYTYRLEQAGLDVISYQVRRGLPNYNIAAMSALNDRWRPETHSFHLPIGDLTVLLKDAQKFLGLRISGLPVIGKCSNDGWREKMEEFLGRPLPPENPTEHSNGVKLSWLREQFGRCPENADDDTVNYHCRAWVLHLFGCVLFPDATGDTASWMFLPCLTDWQTAGGYSWASAVLGFLYRQLCKGCRRTSTSATIGGCVYLLQLWMWSYLPVGRPTAQVRPEWFEVTGLRLRPTYADHWLGAHSTTPRKNAYIKYTDELDKLTPEMVDWEPCRVFDDRHGEDHFSIGCKIDRDMYMMQCPLICFYIAEWQLPHRVARQYGLRQEWPVTPFSTSKQLHGISRKTKTKLKDYESFYSAFVDKWNDYSENMLHNTEPHTEETFVEYLKWYRQRTRSKLKMTAADYADIINNVGDMLQEVLTKSENFPRTNVDEPALGTFLEAMLEIHDHMHDVWKRRDDDKSVHSSAFSWISSLPFDAKIKEWLIGEEKYKQETQQKHILLAVADKFLVDRQAHKTGASILCFDEIQTIDVFAIVALSGILSRLLSTGTVLVATSNKAPEDLNQDGMQRDIVLELLSKLDENCNKILVGTEKDYRRLIPTEDSTEVHYFWPITSDSRSMYEAMWHDIANQVGGNIISVTIPVMFGRSIEIPQSCDGVARFDFEYLCSRPVGAADYIAIARNYHTIFISEIPAMSMKIRDKARRFITLIDELYNHHCRLVCLAASSIDDLFQGTEEGPLFDLESFQFETESEGTKLRRDVLAEGNVGLGPSTTGLVAILSGQEEMFAFRRAISRLIEMQSPLYLERVQDVHPSFRLQSPPNLASSRTAVPQPAPVV